ncbi:MAG: oxidoreductase [Chloroflexi bacterium RBG_19FT_COMBO_55_16]|nr:MAG: oxidoreductase [Chloroflexi bacterium RBG_19FT_COMBO_55_16]
MDRLSLYFTAPRQISVRQETLPSPGRGQALVRTLLSAISPGTELLIYRGEFPPELPLDENIPALAGGFAYPIKYGYAAVGEVIGLGADLDSTWLGKQVFAFQPHASHFLAPVEEMLPLPEGLAVEEAVFLPNMETALNFVLDGQPLIGEKVVVFGQGIVGLLTTALLVQFPLADLITLDRYPLRRQASLDLGAQASLDSSDPQELKLGRARLGGSFSGADLVYELSGNPVALDQAIDYCGFNGRVVIGSWYGSKRASLDLGARFHRSRMRLISSQVSSLAPELSGRWGKARRFQVAWEMLQKVKPSRFITHRFPITQAEKAYQLIDQDPSQTIQLVLEY